VGQIQPQRLWNSRSYSKRIQNSNSSIWIRCKDWWCIVLREINFLLKFVIGSLLISPVEWSYLNTDMRKFESSQTDESRAQSADSSKAVMSNPNGLLSQKLCRCLNQGRTLNDMLMRAAHWMAYFDLSKLTVAYTNVMKAFES